MLEKSLNIESDEDKKIKSEIDFFAKNTIKEVEKKTKLLGFTLNNISNMSDMESNISDDLENLERKIKTLYPSDLDFSKNKKSFLFNPIKKYFNNIKKEEAVFSKLIQNLEQEKSVMNNDNITLKIECERIESIIEILEKEIENGENYKKIIEFQINDGNVQNEILEKLEKKISDLREMLIVKRQSLLAIELIMKNNEEIIRNITRINNVTLEALNTAVLVAYSLYNQKIVLNKINDLQKSDIQIWKATNSNIEEYKNTKIDIENLKQSFDNVISTVDEVKSQNTKSFPENEIKIIELKKEKN